MHGHREHRAQRGPHLYLSLPSQVHSAELMSGDTSSRTAVAGLNRGVHIATSTQVSIAPFVRMSTRCVPSHPSSGWMVCYSLELLGLWVVELSRGRVQFYSHQGGWPPRGAEHGKFGPQGRELRDRHEERPSPRTE